MGLNKLWAGDLMIEDKSFCRFYVNLYKLRPKLYHTILIIYENKHSIFILLSDHL